MASRGALFFSIISIIFYYERIFDTRRNHHHLSDAALVPLPDVTLGMS